MRAICRQQLEVDAQIAQLDKIVGKDRDARKAAARATHRPHHRPAAGAASFHR
jgi:hypothetical protein